MNIRHSGIGMTSQRARDRLITRLEEMGIQSELVLETIRSTPRHLFVDEALASRTYENTALPIGFNQTISQPYVVARMVEAVIGDEPLDKALEVGTGCGYQSVILAQLARQVYTLERLNPLLIRAKKRFYMLKYNNIRSMNGDGTQGWSRYAPYNAIVVSAAPIGVPIALREQLAIDGRLVIPVGKAGKQRLLLITRRKNGFEEEILDWVSFVPLLAGIDH